MTFKPFDPNAETVKREHNLPHWRQDGTTYFITFRLADSLPKEKLAAMAEEQLRWLSLHGLRAVEELPRLAPERQREYRRMFDAKFHALLDAGYGACWLRHPDAARAVTDALTFFDTQRYALDEWIVMPNHVHAIVSPFDGWELSSILHSWKSFTAKQVNRIVDRSGTLWQDESFNHIVRSEEHLDAFRRYIRANPAKAGLRPGEYLARV